MADSKAVGDAEERMKKTIEVMKKDLLTIRTGRASPALLDRIAVDCYGEAMPIKQVANITTPDSKTIMLQPWDRSVLGSIEKAIQKSDLGLNPINDGKVIRLVIPPLTEERRKDLVKVLKKKTEENKVSLRNVRRDAMEELKGLEKSGKISEDEVKRLQEQVQKLTDRYVDELDRIMAAKEKEIMEI